MPKSINFKRCFTKRKFPGWAPGRESGRNLVPHFCSDSVKNKPTTLNRDMSVMRINSFMSAKSYIQAPLNKKKLDIIILCRVSNSSDFIGAMVLVFQFIIYWCVGRLQIRMHHAFLMHHLSKQRLHDLFFPACELEEDIAFEWFCAWFCAHEEYVLANKNKSLGPYWWSHNNPYCQNLIPSPKKKQSLHWADDPTWTASNICFQSALLNHWADMSLGGLWLCLDLLHGFFFFRCSWSF